jgi:hypothetical protein
MNNNRAILITGKTGTGKSTKAKTFFLDEVKILYANDFDFDLGSHPKNAGIIIEDVHYKPKTDDILNVIRNYRGLVVLTSINEKSVPKSIRNMCKIKRAGSFNHLENKIKYLAPNSESPFSFEKDTYSLVSDVLKNKDRDLVAKLLLFNKPSDTQMMSWLIDNLHPNKLLFIDGVVKRRWSQRYFYEMLAYVHSGDGPFRVIMPKRGTYSKVPSLCRRLGIKNPSLLKQLCMDEDFTDWAKTKLNNAECRLLKIGEKKKKGRKKIKKPVEKQKRIGDYI